MLQSHVEGVCEILEFLRPLRISRPLVRLGGDSDGAYLVPDVLERISACFSPGCCNSKLFEDELLDRFGITSFLCDFTSSAEKFSTPFTEGKQFFVKKWLSPSEDKDSISLENWVRNSEARGDLLLQMDIEGAEYVNLASAAVSVVSRFSIMVVEFHWSAEDLDDADKAGSIISGFRKILPLFKCVHMHPNNCCGDFWCPAGQRFVPRVFECTFVRNDVFAEIGCVPHEFVSLPHADDISANVPSKRPLLRANGWGAPSPDSLSVARAIEMAMDYSDHRVSDLERLVQELESRVVEQERRLREIGFPLRVYSRIRRVLKKVSGLVGMVD